MPGHILLGKAGEELASRHLESLGYEVVERNWRLGRNEIDLIARYGKTVIIVEVKTRSSYQEAGPEVAVNRAKQRILVRTANAWMHYRGFKEEVRFDVVTIVMDKKGPKIRHIVDAFYPE